MSASFRRFKASVALASSVALLATACGGGGDGSSGGGLTHISVSVAQAKAIEGLSWAVGQKQGFFKDHGIVVDEIVPAQGGGQTLQNVLAGDLEFGQVATAALVNAHRKGAPIKVIAGASQMPYEIGWAVSKDSDIQTVEDLEGKTWGFTNAGSVTEAMSYLIPARAGLNMGSIKRVATGGVGTGIAMLESGGVDVTFVPPLVAAEHSDTLRVVTHANEFVPRYQLTMIATNGRFAEKHPKATRGLLAALQDSIDWIKTHPEKAGELFASRAEADPQVGKKLVQRYIELDLWSLPFNPEPLKAAAKGLKYTDGIDSVDWEGLLTDKYLPEGSKSQIP